MDLKTLENYTAKYMAYSKQDSKLNEAKPYGVVITKENGDYFLSVWYETINGEKSTAKEKLAVAGGQFQPGEEKLISSIETAGDKLICRPTEALYKEIQIGPVLTEWDCKVLGADNLAVFDVTLEETGKRLDKFTQLNSDISRERGIYAYKRIENSGEVLDIKKDDKGNVIERASVGDVSVKLVNLLDTEKFRALQKGSPVHYRGRIVYID